MRAPSLSFRAAGAVGALLCALLIAAPAWAADTAITATVDKNEAALDDYIVLSVAVEGTRDEPTLPDLSAFKVQSRGTSSQMTIINGRMSSKLEYNYMLYPQKTGTFSVGPFTVDDGGRKVESNTLLITITRAEPQNKDGDEVFVTATVDNEHPYLNEQIIYTFRFCRRIKVASASLVEQPSFDGFLVESLGKEREFEKVINGRQYLVTEIRQALFPLKTGVLEITPTTLQAAVVKQGRSGRGRRGNSFFGDSFFGFTETVPKNFRTAPVSVFVKPLPAEDRPADFKNLVGQFRLTSDLSATKAMVGDSLTLTISLSGTGLLKNLQTIDSGPLENFKVYDDKPLFEPAVINGKTGGKLTIKKALVPIAPGSQNVQAPSISYFDTASKSYKTLTGASYVVHVSPASSKEKLDFMQSPGLPGLRKQEIELLGKDILPLHTAASALHSRSLHLPLAAVLLFMLLPPAIFFAFFGYKRARERAAGDPGAQRQKNAYKNFLTNAAEARKALEDETLFYQSGAKALKDFIGDTCNIAGQALTGQDLDSLYAGKIPPDMLRELKSMFDIFDSGQFGFRKMTTGERSDVLESMQKMVRDLNRVVRK